MHTLTAPLRISQYLPAVSHETATPISQTLCCLFSLLFYLFVDLKLVCFFCLVLLKNFSNEAFKKRLQTLILNRISETLGRGVAKTTKQQHRKKKKVFFSPPRQISFAITALVINFSGNFYTWLVSLSGTIISLPPLQI